MYQISFGCSERSQASTRRTPQCPKRRALQDKWAKIRCLADQTIPQTQRSRAHLTKQAFTLHPSYSFSKRSLRSPLSVQRRPNSQLRPNDRLLDQSPSRAAGRLGPPPTRLLPLPRFRVAYSAPAPAHRRSCRRRAAGPGCGPSSRGARPPGRAARPVPSRVCGPGLHGERAVSRRGTYIALGGDVDANIVVVKSPHRGLRWPGWAQPGPATAACCKTQNYLALEQSWQ